MAVGTRNYWTEERSSAAAKLWLSGQSANSIAKKLGGITRNAVIGRMHRIGVARILVKSRRSTPWKPKVEKVKVLTAPAPERVKEPNLRREPLPPEPPRPAKLVSFEDLTDKTCRFIYGDPKGVEWGYCTCEKAPGSSFCAGHHAKIFNGATVRLRKTTADIGMWSKMMPAEFEVMS